MRKGISPLIAAVLLIAFTMTIALLTGPFLTDITTNAQGDTADEASNLVDASNTAFEINEVVYDTNSGNYTITVQNTGSNPIDSLTTTLEGDDPVQATFSETIGPGQITTFQIQTPTSSNYESIQIDDSNRPVQARESLTNIKQGEAPNSPTGLTVTS